MKLLAALLASAACALLLAPLAVAAPTHHLGIRPILLANDDGSHASPLTGAQIQTMIVNANAVWAGAGIVFDFDPATDIEHRNSTLLNNDCTMFDPFGDPCDTQPNIEEREKVALDAQHDGKITVYFRYGGAKVACQEFACAVKKASGSFSSRAGHYIAMHGSSSDAIGFAHEVGHYLWNTHTHGPAPETLTQARHLIKDYVEGANPHPKSEGLDVFDHDFLSSDAGDTPPDPGPTFWGELKGSSCATGPGTGSQPITVTFSDKTQKVYSLAPDRTNVMSYFRCPALGYTSSPDQRVRARNAVEQWNRGHLLGAVPSYAGLDRRWKGKITTGKTSLVPFMLERQAHLLLYNSVTGDTTIQRVGAAVDGPKAVWTGAFKKGWTTVMPFELDGKPHTLLYNATTGKAKIIRLLGQQGASFVWEGEFKTGYTTMTPFKLGGVPTALLYNATTGKAKIIGLLGAQGWSFVWEGAFKTGWTSLVPIELGGAPHALLYNATTGKAKIIGLLGAQGASFVWQGEWSVGWTSIMPFDRGPQARVLLYKAGTGAAKTLRVPTGGSAPVTMSSSTWSAGYSAVTQFRLPAEWHAFAYDQDDGAARIVRITQ